MKDSCDCIVPFYNEELRPVKVVESIIKIKSISKIIVIDDGSPDTKAYSEIKRRFPQIVLIRLNTNSGKANAIKEGLKHVNSDYVFLIDGDHITIKIDEIENAIHKSINNPEIDMIILRKVEDETVKVSRFIRHEIIFSGERILRTSDLKNVYQNTFSDYQIEMAINTYMMRNRKNVYWMPSSVHAFNKWEKWGYYEGTKRSLRMFNGFVSYAGWKNFIWQTLFFCRDKAPMI